MTKGPMREPVVVANFRTRLDAESAAGLLAHAGIPFVVQSGEGMGMGPLPQGASLIVREDQVDAARRVLADAGLLDEDPA
jgi:Putative prokaryotic signal transducing protein